MLHNHIKQSIIILALTLLSACSAVPDLEENAIEPRVPLPVLSEDEVFVKYNDPFEGFNRRMYYFNAKLDHNVMLPLVKGYQAITPDPVEDGITNFFSNIGEIPTFLNAVLQIKPGVAAETLGRFAVNTTVGILGFFDPATSIGLEKQNEDFGQTLGHYGVGHGPYLVLPFFGPSNVRDATGGIVDFLAFQAMLDELDMKNEEQLFINTIKTIDIRKNIPFTYYQTGSAFEYERMRLLYMKYREIVIER